MRTGLERNNKKKNFLRYVYLSKTSAKLFTGVISSKEKTLSKCDKRISAIFNVK
jgi:hypothetical protein